MKELVKIENKGGIQTVNARTLHEFLGVQSRFNDWIKGRIEKYDFLEGKDFIPITEKKVTAQGNTSEFISYHISLDMAKELSMVENNEQGRKARRYFIACEKRLMDGRKVKKVNDIRDRSKAVRNQFTGTLKAHGYRYPRDYRDTTYHMKKEMDITCKKDDMDEIELCKVTAAEMIATANIKQTEVNGYREVDPVCVDAARVVQIATRQTRQLPA